MKHVKKIITYKCDCCGKEVKKELTEYKLKQFKIKQKQFYKFFGFTVWSRYKKVDFCDTCYHNFILAGLCKIHCRYAEECPFILECKISENCLTSLKNNPIENKDKKKKEDI